MLVVDSESSKDFGEEGRPTTTLMVVEAPERRLWKIVAVVVSAVVIFVVICGFDGEGLADSIDFAVLGVAVGVAALGVAVRVSPVISEDFVFTRFLL